MAMLAHWRVSGEWFSCSPLIARAAVEAAGTGCDRLRALVALASECHSTRAALERLMAEGRDTIEISAAHTRLCDQLHADFPEHADEIAPRVRNARAAQLEKRPKLEKMFSSDFTAIFQPIESAA